MRFLKENTLDMVWFFKIMFCIHDSMNEERGSHEDQII
jgi:hypothetical protein